MSPFEPVDLSAGKLHAIGERRNKVAVADFARVPPAGATVLDWLDSLPDILAARQLREVVDRWSAAAAGGRTVLVGMGGHVIKCGLAPVLRQLVVEGAISAVAMNGAASIHDYEIALIGATSEDVAERLETGRFGMADETGRGIHEALRHGMAHSWGYGEAVARAIVDGGLPYADRSVQAACAGAGVQVTVHVALGTDVIHQHPLMSGAIVGEMSHRDFLRFSGAVRALGRGGLYVNLGSAVLLPEVFLKALAVVRNQDGDGAKFDTLDVDMVPQYRPTENVVRRPGVAGGRGFQITGHHELLVPLLAHCVLERLRRT